MCRCWGLTALGKSGVILGAKVGLHPSVAAFPSLLFYFSFYSFLLQPAAGMSPDWCRTCFPTWPSTSTVFTGFIICILYYYLFNVFL